VTSVETAVRVGAKVAAIPFGVVSRRTAGDAVILCYHRIGEGRREIDVPRGRFLEHIEVLANQTRVATLDEAVSGSHGGVVLTFDDGFRDFYDIVLPLLVSREIPATLYLATGFVDAGSPSDGIGPDGALTWGMLEEAVSTGLVTVGSHTHGHVDLSRASEQQADDEMRRSKHLIEDRLGRACDHFAYPWGKSSPVAERVAADLFTTAALDAWRTNRQGRIEPLRLGRTPVFRSDSGFFFKAKTRGQLDGERLAYRALRRGPWAPS
jgi:peptidoglycan/xylan/chitin deacetylase (PgdA/CDA1 family)